MAHVRPVPRSNGSTAYEVRWLAAGKAKQRTFSVRRDADRFALRIEDGLHKGENTEVYTRQSTTVADVVEASMAVAATKLKPRSLTSYRQAYDLHVLPTFGARRVVTVTSADVERWVADLIAAGLSPATVRNTFVALNKAFRYAVRHRHITANPCTGTELPRATGDAVFRPVFLTPDRVDALAVELQDVPPYDLLVRFAAGTGLRAAEIAGLQVQHINLMRREVLVRRTVQRIRGGWTVGEPKSARSSRNVPILSDALLSELVDHLGAHPARHDPTAPLWPGRAVGSHAVDWSRPFDHQSFYRWYFKPAAARLGLTDLRFHDLRHTYASILLAAGVEVYKVSRWMGHANISTTDSFYAHLYPGDHTADADRLSAYLGSTVAGSAATKVTRLT